MYGVCIRIPNCTGRSKIGQNILHPKIQFLHTVESVKCAWKDERTFLFFILRKTPFNWRFRKIKKKIVGYRTRLTGRFLNFSHFSLYVPVSALLDELEDSINCHRRISVLRLWSRKFILSVVNWSWNASAYSRVILVEVFWQSLFEMVFIHWGFWYRNNEQLVAAAALYSLRIDLLLLFIPHRLWKRLQTSVADETLRNRTVSSIYPAKEVYNRVGKFC